MVGRLNVASLLAYLTVIRPNGLYVKLADSMALRTLIENLSAHGAECSDL